MKYATLVARILLGLVFVGASVAFFATTPPPPPPALEPFFTGMVSTKYFLYLLKVTELVCGLAFLTGFFVPLALVIIAPVILNIFMVHAMLAPEGVPLALVLGALEIYLAFFSKEYSPKIKSLFNAR
jgi:uncharacterized membrane protein YphA (DoxX/SURF4 family)